jgi:hypothetical protein
VSDPTETPNVADDPSRRDFLRLSAAVSVGASALAGCAQPQGSRTTLPAPETTLFRTPPMDRVKIGFVGVGGQGMTHVENFLTIEGVDVKAICDIVPVRVREAQQKTVAAGQPQPAGYDRGPRDFERMIAEQDLDLVFTATPWEWHVPVCLNAMQNGRHAATEVPMAYTVDECWALVEAAERYGKHCLMMENCCYDRREMLMLNLVRQGIFGDLEHAECAYNHDLRSVKFSTDGEGLWRRAHATRRNGNFYPTHGLGPIAQCLNINRGNQFDYLVSMSGPSRGLQNWQQEHLAADDPRRAERYVLGDVNLTLIKTQLGQTIYLVHDTNLPRPYTRINMIQGTRGLMQGWPDRIYVEGRSARNDAWEPLATWYERYEHPFWKSERVQQMSRGHGGMDFLEDWRLIVCLRAGLPTDQNVYDGAAWSVICELTERSVATRSTAMTVPDFTRGKWRSTPPLPIVEA